MLDLHPIIIQKFFKTRFVTLDILTPNAKADKKRTLDKKIPSQLKMKMVRNEISGVPILKLLEFRLFLCLEKCSSGVNSKVTPVSGSFLDTSAVGLQLNADFMIVHDPS